MSGLSVLLVQADSGPALWSTCRHLAQALRPGDDLVVVDAGSQDGSDHLLARFAAEGHWPAGVAVTPLALSGRTDQDPVAAARSRAAGPMHLVMGGHDLARPDGFAQARAAAAEAPELVCVNTGWHLGQGIATLPAPDAARWPADPGPVPATQVADLLPDATRLLGPAAGDDYDATLARVHTVHMVPLPVVLRPFPHRLPAADTAAARLTHLATDLGRAPRRDRAKILRRGLIRVQDALGLMHPDEAPAILAAAATLLARLSRDQRRAAGAQIPLLDVLYTEGRGAARGVLALLLATQDRMHLQTLTQGLSRLREDVDAALPGPEYLRKLYNRTRFS